MIAVEAVETHVAQPCCQASVLYIPPEAEALEPVEQRREPTCPIFRREVDGIDAGIGHRGGATLGTFSHATDPGGVDDARVGAMPQVGQQAPVAVADPQALFGSGVAGSLDDGISCCRILQIDRELEIRSANVVHLGQRGDLRSDAFALERAVGTAHAPVPGDPVVIQHGVSVAAQPYIGFETGRAQLQCHRERLKRIVGAVGTAPAVSKGDRGRAQGRQRLRGHPSIVPLVSMMWLLPVVAFGLLAAVSVVMMRRLVIELRATAQSLASISDAVTSVRTDLVRARDAIDSLDLPSLRQVAGERALGMVLRWAARRVLPL